MQKQLLNLSNIAYFILLLCFGLFLSCSSSRGSSIGSNPVTIATFTGTVFDPPIVGAKVCCDVNENSQCDLSEVYGTSLASGEYSFKYNCSTSIVAEGGVDTVTGKENTVLIADIEDESSYTSNLNPLTTLISNVPDEDKENVLSTILGDTDVDIFKDNFYDSCNNADDGSDSCNVLQTAMHVSALGDTLGSSLTSASDKIDQVDVLKKMAESISEKIAEDPGNFDIIHADTVKEIFSLSIEKSKEIDTSFEISDEKIEVIASATVQLVDEIISKDLSKMEENQSEYQEMFLIGDHIERLMDDEIDVDDFESISDDLSCLMDINRNGVCDKEELTGCTDETAYNYDQTAIIDDGTCIAVVEGCTNPLAYNYDETANVDDSTCLVYGCTNPAAQNYDETATYNDGTCEIVGCNDQTALNFNNEVTVVDNDLCEYDSNTAPVITLNGDSAIQVELGGIYTELGAVSNGGETVSISGTVNVSVLGEYQITYSAVNELNITGTAIRTVTVVDTTSPVISGITESSISITEGVTEIGTFVANEDVVWSLTGTNDSEFSIDTDGQLSLNTASDYELLTGYDISVVATDASSNESTFDLTINVSNINDNLPEFTSGTTFSIGLNQLDIGTIIATDADADTLTYSIITNPSNLFSIDSNTGDLSISQSPTVQTSYTVEVSVSDGENSTSQSLTITVNNNFAPTITSTSFTVDENQTSVGTIAASDVDGDVIV